MDTKLTNTSATAPAAGAAHPIEAQSAGDGDARSNETPAVGTARSNETHTVRATRSNETNTAGSTRSNETHSAEAAHSNEVPAVGTMRSNVASATEDGVTKTSLPAAAKRKWTALRGVKIACFIMIIAQGFQLLCSAFNLDIWSNEVRVSPEVIFMDLSTNQYFAEQHMGGVQSHASVIAYFGSEEAISNGDFLEWTDHDNEYWHNYEVFYDSGSSLTTPGGAYYYARIDRADDTPERRLREENQAIRQQLESYRLSREVLTNTDGLIYHIADSNGTVLSNAGIDTEWFRAQPVYYIRDGSARDEVSHEYNYWYYDYGLIFSYHRFGVAPDIDTSSNYKVYLAFTADEVSAQNSIYREAQREYMLRFAEIAAQLILFIALFVILLMGAGRKRSLEGVHFALIDKPFLDISLAAVIAWTAIAAYIAFDIGWSIWRYQNNTAMYILFAACAVMIGSPAMLWLMSLVKRMKAGKFWRHTLIYFIPSRICRLLKSLWAGFPLTGKVGVISVASFCMLLFTGLFGFSGEGGIVFLSALVFTAVAAFFLLRYAKRIHMLEQSARSISGGAFDAAVNVGKGELGSIANSLKNISDGISVAVDERMKSERLKTELITNVSHDIRTPLTSIITYTDLLKREGLDCADAPEYLEVLIQKSQRLKALTDDLFEAAKAATGNIEVNLEKLDLVSLINQVLGELDSAVKTSCLDLRVMLPEKLLATVDGKLMWRIMENLISNALKYSLPGSRAYLDARPGERFVCIELKNISATELNINPDELTDRFKRGDDSRADGGSGLGLSIVQSFVAAQGGKFNIAIDGDLFKASVFLLR